MKYLNYIVGLLIVLAIIPAFLPSSFEVSRSIEIQNTQEDVYAYLVNLDSWSEWSPWLAMEPEATLKFDGIPGVVGSSSEWKGKVIGHGKQTLTKLNEPDYLETKLEFIEPESSEATAFMKIEPKEYKTLVTWGMKGHLSYPLERVMGLMMKSMIGEQFEQGLKNLKNKLEEPQS